MAEVDKSYSHFLLDIVSVNCDFDTDSNSYIYTLDRPFKLPIGFSKILHS